MDSKKKLLFIEEETQKENLLTTKLKDLYQVDMVGNLEAAVSKLAHKKYHVVLLDLEMKQNDGMRILRELASKKWTSRYPVVVVTDERDMEIEEACLSCGAIDFIRKPYHFSIIKKRMENIIQLYDKQSVLKEQIAHQNKMLRKQNSRLMKIARYDRLTGMYNREVFFEEAQKMLNKEKEVSWYMISSNIRNFKLLNQLFGAERADKILCKQAELIRRLAPEKTVAGRIMSDRFAMIMPREIFSKKIFIRALQELQRMIRDSNYQLQYKIGIYEVTDVREPVQDMYDKAYLAVDSLADDSHEIIVYYDDYVIQQGTREKRILSEYETAIANKQFCMYLQPQFSNRGELTGAEALVRWNHPKKGILYPGEFIDVLEKYGVIHKLDMFIWEEAAKQLRAWKEEKKHNISISVNVSANDFYFIDIYDKFDALVKKYDIEPQMLKIEITETVVIREMDMALEMIGKLRHDGFCVEMDDFGSGYSSLNMLKDINVDVLKLDMVFLRENKNQERSNIIMQAIITMAKQLGMYVLSEGVETKEQIDRLTDMGCDTFQGFFFEKPIPVPAFEQKYM